jgi:carbonic anhydrase
MALEGLLDRNKAWANEMRARDPSFFAHLAAQHAPEFLWIGCSDARVPANEIVGLEPGELFVHRNVGNVVAHTDLNCLSVLQYAVCVLNVKHIVVTGHYGCGGVKAALENQSHGLIDNWLRGIKDLYERNRNELETLPPTARYDRMCELNVLEQMLNVCHTTFVQEAWRNGQELAVHGWIYDIKDGLVKELRPPIAGQAQVADVYRLTR